MPDRAQDRPWLKNVVFPDWVADVPSLKKVVPPDCIEFNSSLLEVVPPERVEMLPSLQKVVLPECVPDRPLSQKTLFPLVVQFCANADVAAIMLSAAAIRIDFLISPPLVGRETTPLRSISTPSLPSASAGPPRRTEGLPSPPSGLPVARCRIPDLGRNAPQDSPIPPEHVQSRTFRAMP